MQEKNTKLQLNSENGGITFALFMAGYILLCFVGQAVVGAIFGNSSSAYKAICATFSALSVIVVILVYTLYGKNKFSQITSTNRSGGWFLMLAVLLFAGMFFGLGFVNQSIATIFKSFGLNVSGISLSMPTIWHFIVFSISHAVLPAVFEELFFRGILLNSFKGLKRVVSVLISALLFALYHQSLVQFLYQFIYGVALGFLAITAKSVFPCMIAHFLNNFAVILFTFLKISIDFFSALSIVLGANALAFFGAIIFFALKKAPKNQATKGECKRFFLPFGVLGIVVCLVVAICNLVII